MECLDRNHDNALVVSVRMVSTHIKWVMIDTSNSISPLEIINLHITFRDELYSKTIITKFMVINIPSTYNIIVDQLTLNKLQAIVSTYHMMMKFPTSTNVDELRSNLRESQ